MQHSLYRINYSADFCEDNVQIHHVMSLDEFKVLRSHVFMLELFMNLFGHKAVFLFKKK
jgi:hypothetical protein